MKGIYALVISVDTDISLHVGNLGRIKLNKGLYVYFGSAQSSLEKRVARHLRKGTRNKFWHIDYLLSKDGVRILSVFTKNAGKMIECELARRACVKGTPIRHFGSSDCHCVSHLIKLENLASVLLEMHEIAPRLE